MSPSAMASCRAGFELILGDACRALVAFSDATRNIVVLDWQSRLGVADAVRASEKRYVLVPPQPMLGGATPRPARARPLFAFVVGDFYRKGGLQTLKALKRLYRRGVRDWDAVSVGRLGSFGDYASATDASSADADRAMIGRMAGRVTHHERMPGAQVLELLGRADYDLFPILVASFGYSLLEAMASGAVVVTTNVRAMAEVVDDDTGYSIRLPLDAQREVHRCKNFPAVKSLLTDELERVILTALALPTHERLGKAEAAVARLRARHDPKKHAAALCDLYRRLLGMDRTEPRVDRSTNGVMPSTWRS